MPDCSKGSRIRSSSLLWSMRAPHWGVESVSQHPCKRTCSSTYPSHRPPHPPPPPAIHLPLSPKVLTMFVLSQRMLFTWLLACNCSLSFSSSLPLIPSPSSPLLSSISPLLSPSSVPPSSPHFLSCYGFSVLLVKDKVLNSLIVQDSLSSPPLFLPLAPAPFSPP